MTHLKNKFFWVLMTGIFLAAWYLQSQLFLNWDVSYLLHAAKLLLNGGTYAQDFFTPNPPLILYLYLPPLFLTKLLGLKLILAVRLYVFSLATLSLGLCYFLIINPLSHLWERGGCEGLDLSGASLESAKSGPSPPAPLPQVGEGNYLAKIFLLTLAVIFLIVPVYDFGQREHLLLILALPYLLLLASRLDGYSPDWRFAALVGLLSGIGFALKPQFLVTPVLLELYYIAVRRNIFSWARVETLVSLSFLMIYALSCFIFFPDFIFVVLPYVLRNYYLSIGTAWQGYLANATVLFCFLPFSLYAALYKNNPYKNLCTVLALALVSFLFSYITQRTNFYYHCLPAYSLAILLLVFLFSILILRPRRSLSAYWGVALSGTLFLALLYFEVKGIWVLLIFAPILFFSFFGFLFAGLLTFFWGGEKSWKIISSVALILMLGFLCSYLAQRISWTDHSFLITTGVLLLLFALFAPRTPYGLGTNLFIAVLGMLLFAYPVYFGYCIYWRSLGYKERVLDKLITFAATQTPHHSLSIFSMRGNYLSPLVDYVDSQLAQRFDCLWPAVGFLKQEQGLAFSKLESKQYLQDKNLFIGMITEDLRKNKPDLILVDKRDANLLVWDKQFSYLTFFSQSQAFKNEWKAYRYLTTLKEGSLYELEVYKRQPEVIAALRSQ